MKVKESAEIAIADACRIEHIISEETFEAVRKHVNRYKKEGL